MSASTVYLVGAGPGDPGLITLRGLERLRTADVVLYDALVHPSLLEHARDGAELVFVGKRGGHESARQTHINEELVRYARLGKRVVRLKGGDPLLFGRGSEEAEHLHAEGVPFEIVPGVPSPIAASAYAGVTLTHRTLASSVAYITATESDEKERSTHDWSKLATATQTLVIFMGVRKLRLQMQLLAEHGRPETTPVAVVQSASLAKQRVVVGTLADIADRVEAEGIGMPALTIVGEVVGLRDALRWFERLPLFGKRVLVTRALDQASSLVERLREHGADAIEAPTIRIAETEDRRDLDEALRGLDGFDVVVLTSQNAVDHVFARLSALGADARAFGRARIAAVGPRTDEALRRYGLRADLVPTDAFKGTALAARILQVLGDPRGKRVLLPRARIAHEDLPEALRAEGVAVTSVVAYETLPPTPETAEAIRARFDRGDVDAVLFTSSSTVENLTSVLGDDAPAILARVVTASIGPSTTRTAARLGVPVTFTAPESTTRALVDALAAHYERARSA